MIGIAIASRSIHENAFHAGVEAFARTASPRRWGDVVVIPYPLFQPGRLGRYRLDGLIGFIWSREIEEEAAALGVPVVNVSTMLPAVAFPTVCLDNHATGQAAASYFLERGYRHFAFVPTWWSAAYSDERGLGFAAGVAAAGYRLHWYGQHGVELPANVEHGADSIAGWLRSLPRPLALFAAQDAMAVVARTAADAAQLHVPEQVSILGVDNDPSVWDAGGSISSIVPPLTQAGREAAALLDTMLDGAAPPAGHVVRLPPGEVITRPSSDARAIDDAVVLDALRYIREHAREGINATDVVASIPLSRRALERRFRGVVGTTIKDAITASRVAYARKLLASTNMSVDEISHACGFADRNRFLVAFRAATGHAPGRYRAALRLAPDAPQRY